METGYLESAIRQFEYYRMLGQKTIDRVPEEKLTWQINSESNSIAIIVEHLSGNMLSRWTDFLTSDGEKSWRNRDAEFIPALSSRTEITAAWNKGWDCLFTALNGLKEEDLGRIVYIRNQGHTVMEAINRQLAHYPYHVGQIVFLGKMICDSGWQSLSIPKGESNAYNAEKFSAEKHRAHFTDEFIGKEKT